MVPMRTVANGRQRLQASLQQAHARAGHLEYGFLIHARKEPYRLVLGIITLSGESMPLTPSLLEALVGQQVWLSGQTKVLLEAMIPPTGDPGRPVDTLLMTVLPERREPRDQPEDVNEALGLSTYSDLAEEFDPGELVEIREEEEVAEMEGIEAYVAADSLLRPLVMLTGARPVGWPK